MAETVKGINIKLSLDGKDLENEIKGINKDLKEQQRDLRAINANLRYDSSNLELWKKKQGQLNEILKSTKERLEKQNEQLAKAKEGLKLGTISDAEFKKLERNISYTEADLRKVNSELDKTKDKMKSLGNEKFENLTKLGGTLTKSLTMPILGAVTALTALANKGINTADELKNTAQKIGMNVEALQEWNHVARLAGVETSSLEKAFTKVNNILADVALGDVKSFAGVFHALGISMDEIEGKTTEEAFDIIREALNKVEDQALRTALANNLFGDKLGSELIPILGLEQDEIARLRNEARLLGLITEEQIEQTSGYKDSLDRLKQSTTALSVEIASVMIPAMSRVVSILQDKVIPAVKSAVQWWQNLDDRTKAIIVALTGLVAAVGPVITIIGKVGPIIKTVSIAFKALGSAGLFAGAGVSIPIWLMILKPFIEVFGSILIGGVIGFILAKVGKRFDRERDDIQVLAVASVVLTIGVTMVLNSQSVLGQYGISMSSLLSSITAGTMVANLTRRPERTFNAVNDFTTPFYIMFFTLAGASLNIGVIKTEWLIAVVSLVYIIARGAGKYLGTNLGARVAKSDENIRKYLGLALLPQGGISIGLLVIISTQMSSMYPVISTIIMLSVLVYETSGPIFAKIAISRSGEVDGLDKLEELSSIADLVMEGE